MAAPSSDAAGPPDPPTAHVGLGAEAGRSSGSTTRLDRTLAIGFGLAALALPFILDALGAGYYLSLASRIVIYAIAATSLNLVLGYAGLVSFGHAAFVGLGAYATGILVSEGVVGSGWHLLATLAVTGLAALTIGAISLRTRGVYFIMITLAFAQMLFYLANSVKGYGGDEGLNIRARSILGFGSFAVDLKNPLVLWYVAVAVLGASLLALARFGPSRLGRAVLALRDDDVRAEALGFPTYRLKLVVFVVAGALGGVAGALSVNLQGYVSPNVLHWTQSGTLMVMVILGGVATVWGGLVGAAALLLLQEVLAAYTEHWEFWTGWVLLAVVLFARQGLVGLLGSAGRSAGRVRANERACVDRQRSRRPRASADGASAMTQTAGAPPLLDIRGLEKRFGGLLATDRVDLQLRRGEVHALIGPNGAGKTTLIAQLGGQLASDRGRIVFDGTDITRLSPHQRARRGLVRSFQLTRLFGSASVLDNVALAVQAVSGHSFAAWRPVRREAALFARAAAVLDDVGLAAKAQSGIAALSHGERRALEVGLALASHPRLVLLDEPMAGLGPNESARMERLIGKVRQNSSVLLVEHDVDAVFRLADRVSVLVGGRLIATGAPAEVRSDPNVIAAYLGDDEAHLDGGTEEADSKRR